MNINKPVLETIGDQFSFRHVIQPVQLPARMLAPVEGREASDAPLQLVWQREHARLLKGP